MDPTPLRSPRSALLLAIAALAGGLAADSEPSTGAKFEAPALDDADVRFFEERVRPLLDANCFRCHGPDAKRLRGGLRLASRATLLAGGDSGPAVVPGDPDASLLVQAVRWSDANLEMPPDERLPEEVVATLEEWVRRGAPWPDYGDVAIHEQSEGGIDYATGRQWWSFRPIVAPPIPVFAVDGDGEDGGACEPLDAFVRARLDEAGIAPNPRAGERELVRRAYVDLIGLPPTFEELEAWSADPAPDKWSRLVDELLARPEYGQRWATFWLDLVRFAQTNGYERDAEKPFAWRYRDWIIDALNEDLPYDEFLRHQLAGDELDVVTPSSLIATGFYRVGAWDDEPDDPEQAYYDELDDYVRVVGEGFLGITLGCARCHDHKFDPISQADYTGMVAFFKNVRPYEVPRFAPQSAALRPLDGSAGAWRGWKRARDQRVLELRSSIAGAISEGKNKAQVDGAEGTISRGDGLRALARGRIQEVLLLQAELKDIQDSFAGELPWALVVREKGAELEPTRLFVRGNATAPAAVVPARFPLAACPDDAAAVPRIESPLGGRRADESQQLRETTSGARRALADWITAPTNPLTARVIVNRIWQEHFGRGLVPSPNDFGRAGEPPKDPALLDHLAAEFAADGWSLKRLHRRILHSQTWQRSSHASNPVALALDPANELWWRQTARRLSAETLHDALLHASGELDPSAGGRGFFPRLSAQALAGMSRPAEGWGVSSASERARRAVHAYVKRGMLVPFLTTFDYGDATLPIGRRLETNIATQAMALMNGEFANERAAALAARVLRDCPPPASSGSGEARDRVQRAWITRAWELVLARRPAPDELALALDYLNATAADFDRRDPELVFLMRVPERTATDFLLSASGPDLVQGPDGPWSAWSGSWGDNYNGTAACDEDHGPITVFDPAVFARAQLEALVRLAPGVRRAALALGVVRRTRGTDEWTGLQLVLDVEQEELSLRRSSEDGSSVAVLAQSACALPPEVPLRVTIELGAQTVVATLTPSPPNGNRPGNGPGNAEDNGSESALPIELRAALETPLAAGQLGVRTLGGALALTGALEADGVRYALAPQNPGTADELALESLCLMLFNLNEFLYVD